ncbi:hypothetical protein FRX31_029139 [Thalictrum thalictroides]|uniref:FAR1 domain-containing protein n=1 Tax=Thalictrum thalictroides TaxID=46969 RepID=A0A7J6V8I3_THATH|nr:hypothetical protein FRX31_029139 [Thalictrum thalictroides]
MENSTFEFDGINDNCIDEEDIEVEDDDIDDIEKTKELTIGMDFASSEELYHYYVQYGSEKGFPVMKRSSKKGDDGIVRWVTFACARSGKSESTSRNAFKMQPITKTSCKAKLNAALCRDGSWRVTVADLDHNHDLSPGKS